MRSMKSLNRKPTLPDDVMLTEAELYGDNSPNNFEEVAQAQAAKFARWILNNISFSRTVTLTDKKQYRVIISEFLPEADYEALKKMAGEK